MNRRPGRANMLCECVCVRTFLFSVLCTVMRLVLLYKSAAAAVLLWEPPKNYIHVRLTRRALSLFLSLSSLRLAELAAKLCNVRCAVEKLICAAASGNQFRATLELFIAERFALRPACDFTC
jgi:hypothetical protein